MNILLHVITIVDSNWLLRVLHFHKWYGLLVNGTQPTGSTTFDSYEMWSTWTMIAVIIQSGLVEGSKNDGRSAYLLLVVAY